MRLVRVELHRFRARRAVALMLLGVLLLVGWLTVDTIWSTRPVSETEVAAAKEQAAQDLGFMKEEYQRCLDDPESYLGSGDLPASDCPQPESDYRWYLTRSPLSLEEELGDTGKASVMLLAGIAIIIGATFAGADWASGSMGNQLLFRPRRLQVWWAKAVAVALGVTAAAAVVLAMQWGAYWATAAIRDVGHSPGFVDDLLSTNLRGLVLVMGGGLGGFALTMLLRSTVGTLALLFVYAVAGEALVAALPFERATQWALSNNVFAWFDDGVDVYDDSISCTPSTLECVQQYTVSLAHGAVYLGVMLAVAVALSLLLYRRRDVP